jgi:serine protease
MKKRSANLMETVRSAVALLLLAATAIAGASTSNRYFIAMKFPTASMTAPQKQTLQVQRQALIQQLQSSQFSGQLESQLEKIHGLVVQNPSKAEIEKLKSHPAVEFVDKEIMHEDPRPVIGITYHGEMQQVRRQQNSGQGTPWGIRAVRAPEAWKASQAGLGARVLVLDTGIDKDHPSLAANFEEGQDFVKDPTPRPYAFFDLGGHGTHVAGTIAGVLDNSGFTGVAPQARVLMGRVCFKGCSNIAIASGVNWGVEKKVDLISMSLGGAFSTPSERRAIQLALNSGITVIAASGNSGEGKVSYPAALPGVIAVGASDINNQKASFSQFGPELAIVAPGVDVISSVPQGTGLDPEVRLAVGGQNFQLVKSTTFQGSFAPVRPMINELVFANLGRPDDLQKVDVRGKFALVQRGEIKFAEKAVNAIKAGAAGLVVFNNAPGLIRGSLTEDESTLKIPVFMVEQQVGETLVKVLSQGQVARASLVVVQTNYSSFDGTSMATPHVAGVVALMKAANKALLPNQVKQILMGTAMPLQPNGNNELGAGLVNAQRAVEASVRVQRPQQQVRN